MTDLPEHQFNTSFLTKHFSNLQDPRRTDKGNLRHRLSDILLLVLSAVLSRCQEWDEIILFGSQELDWLKKHGSFDNGIPSKDTLRRFFAALDPESFQACFVQWISTFRNEVLLEVVSIDGKTIRGASTKSDTESISPHIISALASEQGLCLGQIKVEDKSNEITAIPKLLNSLSIENCTITIDAMGCQTEIIKTIRSNQANYIVAVKGNQGQLYQAIKDAFMLEKPIDTGTDNDCGHGRVEKRTCHVYSDMSHLENHQRWKDLKTFIIIEKEVFYKATQETKNEMRYYISNLNISASQINTMVREHWAIENKLHWVLDVVFEEDYARKRIGNSAENFNLVLKMALLLINKEKTFKKSKNNKRLKALLDREYREKLMMF
tara:strand:- start:151 stop:1287 length:1137 start_codon:yes stop_codon:yes gene_type:complete